MIAGAAAPLDADLRRHAIAAAHRLAETGADEVKVVAPTPSAGNWPSDATWDFAGFGVARRDADDLPRLPWPLGIGAWLLDESGWTGARSYLGLGAGGSMTSSRSGTTAILAIGDGSARRTETAPGHLDPRAEAFDAVIADAMATGNVEALAAIDQGLAEELMCAGLPTWRWIARALAGQSVTAAELTADVAPYGVGYFVASWTLA